LIPDDPESEARLIETVDYVEGTIHGQGFARLFVPQRFEPQDIVHQATGLGAASVRAQGGQKIEEGFAILDPRLARSDYVIGDGFSIGDAALFCVERWAPQQHITLPVNLQRHFDRMLARPAVQKVREIWGEA
jgi:glutathione S-transferase